MPPFAELFVESSLGKGAKRMKNMRFTHAIVRTPCAAVIEGITSNPQLGKPDVQEALRQHEGYIQALRACGLQVTVLPPAEDFPDSCFVEDVAVLTEQCAILTNPGAPSRTGETALIEETIRAFYPPSAVHRIKAPGAMEGGDVMRVGDCFYVGLSERTNAEGFRQFGEILAQYGYTAQEVELDEMLHLKTGVNYLENGNMLVFGEFVDKAQFAGFNRATIPDDEGYAANSLWVNGTVLVPENHPKTAALIAGLGYPVVRVDTSEFMKIDGGLSCLSLRFQPPTVGSLQKFDGE
jgi:dimethylargininase